MLPCLFGSVQDCCVLLASVEVYEAILPGRSVLDMSVLSASPLSCALRMQSFSSCSTRYILGRVHFPSLFAVYEAFILYLSLLGLPFS